MPEVPRRMIEKGIKSLREAGMLEQIYYVRTKDSPNNYNSLEDPENIQSREYTTIKSFRNVW